MIPAEIIEKKRDGKNLNPNEIKWFIDNIVKNKIDTRIARKVRPRTEREKAAQGKKPPVKLSVHPMIVRKAAIAAK